MLGDSHRSPGGSPKPYLRGFRPLDPDRFDMTLGHADLGAGVRLSCITWGGPVEVETEPVESWHVVTVPIEGQVEVCSGSTSVVATPQRAAVIGPGEETRQRWSADAAAIWVQLDKDTLEVEAQYLRRAELRTIHLPPRQPVLLGREFDLTTADGREWHGLLWRLINLIDKHGTVDRVAPHRIRVPRQQLVTALLRARRNS